MNKRNFLLGLFLVIGSCNTVWASNNEKTVMSFAALEQGSRVSAPGFAHPLDKVNSGLPITKKVSKIRRVRGNAFQEDSNKKDVNAQGAPNADLSADIKKTPGANSNPVASIQLGLKNQLTKQASEMRELEKQLKEFEKLKKEKAELEEKAQLKLQSELFKQEDKFTQQINQLNVTIRHLETKKDEAVETAVLAEQGKGAEEKKSLQEQIKAKEGLLNETQEALRNVKSEVSEVRDNYALANEKTKNLIHEMQTLNKENLKAKEVMETKLRQSASEIESLKENNEFLRLKIENDAKAFRASLNESETAAVKKYGELEKWFTVFTSESSNKLKGLQTLHDKEVVSLRQDLETLRASNAMFTQENAKLIQEKEKLIQEKETQRKAVIDLQTQNETLTINNEKLKEDLSKKVPVDSVAKTVADKFQNDRDAAIQARAVLEQEKVSTTERLKFTEGKLKEVIKAKDDQDKIYDALKVRLEAAVQSEKETATKLQASSNDLGSAQTRLNELSEKTNALNAEINQLKLKLQEAGSTAEVEALKKGVEALKDRHAEALREAKTALDAATQEAADAAKRVEVAATAEKNLQIQLAGKAKELAAKTAVSLKTPWAKYLAFATTFLSTVGLAGFAILKPNAALFTLIRNFCGFGKVA
jgi:hypothetical protein